MKQFLKQKISISNKEAQDIIQLLYKLPKEASLEYLQSLIGDDVSNPIISTFYSSHKFTPRKPCECLGSIHGLINNCINCGRIICKAEGEGECFFCGNLVLEMQNIHDKSLVNTDAYLNAEKQKHRLLQMDKSCLKNVVVDAASDYDMNAGMYDKWASATDRALAVKRNQELIERRESKKEMVMTLDLENKRVIYSEKNPVKSQESSNALAREGIEMPRGSIRNPFVRVAVEYVSQEAI